MHSGLPNMQCSSQSWRTAVAGTSIAGAISHSWWSTLPANIFMFSSGRINCRDGGHYIPHPYLLIVDKLISNNFYLGAVVLASVLFSSLVRSQSINRESNISLSRCSSHLCALPANIFALHCASCKPPHKEVRCIVHCVHGWTALFSSSPLLTLLSIIGVANFLFETIGGQSFTYVLLSRFFRPIEMNATVKNVANSCQNQPSSSCPKTVRTLCGCRPFDK